MKFRNAFSLLLLLSIGFGVSACGAGDSGATTTLQTGPWNMTFSPGIQNAQSNGPNSCAQNGESQVTTLMIGSSYLTYAYNATLTNGILFNGIFESQIGGGQTGNCFSGNMLAPSSVSYPPLSSTCTVLNNASNTVRFYGCSLYSTGLTYVFNASYQVQSPSGVVLLTGSVSGSTGQ